MLDAQAFAKLVNRDQRLRERMHPWRPIWQDLADFMIPRKAQVQYKTLWGPRRQTERMRDETAVDAAQKLAATMQGSLTSPSMKWFSLVMKDQLLRNQVTLQDWLEVVTKSIYDALQDSNFNEEIQELYFDLGVFGVGAMFMEETDATAREWSGFRFETLQIGDYAIDEDAHGNVNVLHREFWTSNSSIVERWDRLVTDTPSRAWESFKVKADKDPYGLTGVTHAVAPRPGVPKTERRRVGRLKPFSSVYWLSDLKVQLEEGGFDWFPFLVPRWSKNGSEVYGRGPGITALPPTLTLNAAIELDMKSWAKDLDPPMKVRDRGVVSRVRTSPAAMNVVRDMDSIAPLFDKARIASYQPTQIRAERYERKIREIFFYDQIQLPGGGAGDSAQNTYMSATEVERRWQLMQRLLGPTLGRLKTELHRPLIENAFRLMARRRMLTEAPAELVELSRKSQQMPETMVMYEGPLERAQRASALEGIGRAWAMTAPLIEAEGKAPQSEVMDRIVLDEVVKGIWEAAGTPSKMIRSDGEVADKREARAQAQQQEAERVRQMETAEAAGKAAPAAGAVRELQAAGMIQPPQEAGPSGEA